MSATSASAYDEVIYPSAIYPQTHPDRLATIAHLMGLGPAAVSGARVIELGCGDGANLITMAFGLPGSQFHGVDLAGEPIRKGNQLIHTLGLTNVSLRQLDLLETPADLGRFDFIIAHGLYSWVPAPARDKILALCGAHLADQGVAYVSYNAYPGNHLRDIVRHMMRFHVQNFSAPMEKVRQARALVKFAADAKPNPGLWQNVLKQQSERVSRYTDAGFFHDDLSAINQPFYFHEFMEQAAVHGLQYLSEADLPEMLGEGFGAEVTAMLRQLDSANVIVREQYLDFLKGRSFRQTLLCRRDTKLDRALKPERALALLAVAETRLVKPDAVISSSATEDFAGPRGAVIGTSHPVVKAALVHLGNVFPQAVPVQDLVHLARERCSGPVHSTKASGSSSKSPGHAAGEAMAPGPPREVSFASDAADLAEFLVRTCAMGFVELYTHAPPFTTHISEKPVASALARCQIQQGEVISTLRHQTYKVEGLLSQTLLRLLDGTHDHAALLRILGELLRSGAATITREGQPLANLAEAEAMLPSQLEENLRRLARAGVLVA